MYGALDISTSGLVAQRTRMDVISTNIANKDSFLDENMENRPFRRRVAMLMPGDPASGSPDGVHVAEIVEDPAEFTKRYQPNSPYADADGMVQYPNVDGTVEQINAIEAARSYEANIAAIEATKSMIALALEMIA